jgi:hypothetical protein
VQGSAVDPGFPDKSNCVRWRFRFRAHRGASSARDQRLSQERSAAVAQVVHWTVAVTDAPLTA